MGQSVQRAELCWHQTFQAGFAVKEQSPPTIGYLTCRLPDCDAWPRAKNTSAAQAGVQLQGCRFCTGSEPLSINISPREPRNLLSRLGGVDGFDQDESGGESDEGSKVSLCFLATKSNPLETFQLSDSLLNTRPPPVERLGKYLGNDPGVFPERNDRHRTMFACDLSVFSTVHCLTGHACMPEKDNPCPRPPHEAGYPAQGAAESRNVGNLMPPHRSGRTPREAP
jgi:hypothetical protein